MHECMHACMYMYYHPNVYTKVLTVGSWETYWRGEAGLREMCLPFNAEVIPFDGGHCGEGQDTMEKALKYLMG